MNVVWQDHDRVQRGPDGGALLRLLHGPLPAHWRQGQVGTHSVCRLAALLMFFETKLLPMLLCSCSYVSG